MRTIAQIDAELARLKAENRALKPVISIGPGFKRSRSFRPEGGGQRKPRIRDTGHLQFIRRLPCVATFARTGAQACGISFQQVQKYEAGTNRVAASRLYVIARTLEIAPADLLPSPEWETAPDLAGDALERLSGLLGQIAPLVAEGIKTAGRRLEPRPAVGGLPHD